MKDGLSQNEEKAQTFLDFFDSLKTLIGFSYKCFEGGASVHNVSKLKLRENGFKSHNSEIEKDSVKEFFSFFIRTFVKVKAF